MLDTYLPIELHYCDQASPPKEKEKNSIKSGLAISTETKAEYNPRQSKCQPCGGKPPTCQPAAM